MKDHINHPLTTQYLSLVVGHPVFSSFNTHDLNDLLTECTIKTYQTGEVITQEGDLIDAVYFILEGQCEVRKHTAKGDQPIATLMQGETIGLNTFGLYSSTGLRTATVVALTAVAVLYLEIELLEHFLKSHTLAETIFSKQLDLLMRMRFIKAVAPFESLANQFIKEIAEKITEVYYDEDAIIFSQNEPGNTCYVITQGMVEISIVGADHNKKILAELETGTVFGETALMLDLPRNATARAKTKVTMLQIDKTLFKKIFQQKVDVAEALMRLQLHRSRPVRLPEIEMFKNTKADGSTEIILRNIHQGKYFQLSEQGFFIWNLLNGELSINDLTIEFFLKYDSFNPDGLASYIFRLHDAGFIKLDIDEKLKENLSKMPTWLKVISKIRDIMEFRIAFGSSDEWITRMYAKYLWICYTKPALWLFHSIALLGFTSFVYHFSVYTHLLISSPHKWGFFFLIYFFSDVNHSFS